MKCLDKDPISKYITIFLTFKISPVADKSFKYSENQFNDHLRHPLKSKLRIGSSKYPGFLFAGLRWNSNSI
jgi:hypothetical protein